MKVIFLNCWQGNIKDKLFEFVISNLKDTDIFALSETTHDLFNQLSKELTDFNGVASYKNTGTRANYEISIFSKKNAKVVSKSINNIEDPKQGDFVVVEFENFVCITVHGFSQPGDKNDTNERLKQSKAIINFATKYTKPVIIGGDFNLNPETESIKMIEEAGFVNLITKFDIKKTRSKYAWEQAERQQKELGLPFYGRQYFADYCFVSPDVKVKDFLVPDVEVSDHLPLILEFEV